MTPPHPDFDYFAGHEAGEKSNRLLLRQLAGCLSVLRLLCGVFCKAGSESPRAYRFVKGQGNSSRPESAQWCRNMLKRRAKNGGVQDEHFWAFQDLFSAGIGASRVRDLGACRGTAQAGCESRAREAAAQAVRPGPVHAGPGAMRAGPGPVHAGPGPVRAGPGPVHAGPMRAGSAPGRGPQVAHVGHGRLATHNFAGHAYHGHVAWQGGHWRHEIHDGRDGWWWDVGGAWYFYPQQMDGPPAYVSDVEAIDDSAGPDEPPVAAGYAPP